jgi:hypothetical protein
MCETAFKNNMLGRNSFSAHSAVLRVLCVEFLSLNVILACARMTVLIVDPLMPDAAQLALPRFLV